MLFGSLTSSDPNILTRVVLGAPILALIVDQCMFRKSFKSTESEIQLMGCLRKSRTALIIAQKRHITDPQNTLFDITDRKSLKRIAKSPKETNVEHHLIDRLAAKKCAGVDPIYTTKHNNIDKEMMNGM